MINWRKITLIELMYIVVFIISIFIGVIIFKLVEAGKFTWEHLFWMITLLGNIGK